MSKVLRVTLITSLLTLVLAPKVNAQSTVTIEKPNAGIVVDDNKGISNVIKGCLITAGLDDVTVKDLTNINEIITGYDNLTGLSTEKKQIELANEELTLANSIIDNSNTDNNVAELLAKCKVHYLQNNTLTNLEIKIIANTLKIKLNDTQIKEIKSLVNKLAEQGYDKTNLILDLRTQYTESYNLVLNALKNIFK